jgi:hypothetical protein
MIHVSFNLKRQELPTTDNHYTDLVGKVKHYGKKLLDQACTELVERVHAAIRLKHRVASPCGIA